MPRYAGSPMAETRRGLTRIAANPLWVAAKARVHSTITVEVAIGYSARTFDFDDGGDLSLAKSPKEVRRLPDSRGRRLRAGIASEIYFPGGGELSCAASVRVRGGKPGKQGEAVESRT